MRNIVITGSASGIGLACVEKFKALGDRVIGIDIRDADIIGDLSTPEGRRGAMDKVLELTDNTIDGLILSAGLSGVDAPADLTLSVNYFGSSELMDGLHGAMVGRPNACIVCLVSTSCRFVQGDDPMVEALLEGDEAKCRTMILEQDEGSAYPFSKHALARLIRLRASEWAEQGIRVTACVPGMTMTPMVEALMKEEEIKELLESLHAPLGRKGTSEEMAGVVAFLCSEEASFISGTMIWVDGAQDARDNPDIF
jgi:NAD(P)-dependent dehydrogenase (short-subunit alcohol dehydrogenase family)